MGLQRQRFGRRQHLEQVGEVAGDVARAGVRRPAWPARWGACPSHSSAHGRPSGAGAEEVGDERGVAPGVVLHDARDGSARRERSVRAREPPPADYRHDGACVTPSAPHCSSSRCWPSPPVATTRPTEDAGATLPPVATARRRRRRPRRRGGYDVATAPDDVVISVTVEGGFVPAGVAFVNPPVALVTGDGRALHDRPGHGHLPRPAAAEHPAALDHAGRPAGADRRGRRARPARRRHLRAQRPDRRRRDDHRHDHRRRHDVPPRGVRARVRHRDRPGPPGPRRVRRRRCRTCRRPSAPPSSAPRSRSSPSTT